MDSKTLFLIGIFAVLAGNVSSYHYHRHPFRWWGTDVYIKEGLPASEVERIRSNDRIKQDAQLDREREKYNNRTTANDLLYKKVIEELFKETDKVSDMNAKISNLVTSFIEQHVEFVDNSTKNHNQQVENMQKLMNNDIQKFLTNHANIITDMMKDHKHFSDFSKDELQNLSIKFNEDLTKNQERYDGILDHFIKNHKNQTNEFNFLRRNVTNHIVNDFENNLKEESDKVTRERIVVFYVGIGGGAFFVILFIALIVKVLFLGNKKSVNYPIQYPGIVGQPQDIRRSNGHNDYEFVPIRY